MTRRRPEPGPEGRDRGAGTDGPGTGDGRLELDDLGGVIDGASHVDGPEVLERGTDGAPWASRLEGTWAHSMWARHRAAVTIAAVVVGLAVVGLAAHQAGQPPPLDERVVATVRLATLDGVDGSVALEGPDGDVAHARFLVTDVPAGDRVEILGVRGPGLGATQGERIAATPEQGAAGEHWTASAIVSCASSEALAAGDDAFTLALRRTDRWGRTVDAEVPLPAGSATWSDTVRTACWERLSASGVTITDVEARPDPRRSMVSLGLLVTSALPLDVTVGTVADDQGAVEVGQSFRTLLPARGTAELEVALRIAGCEGAAVPRVLAQSASGAVVADGPGVGLLVETLGSAMTAYVPVPLTAEQQAVVERAIAAVCEGAPRITVTRVAVDGVRALGGPSDERDVVLRLGVSPAPAGPSQLTVVGDYGLPTLFSSTTAFGPGTSSDVRVSWRLACLNTPSPPQVEGTFSDGSRTWPWRTRLTDRLLERTVLRSCAVQTKAALEGAGWLPAA